MHGAAAGGELQELQWMSQQGYCSSDNWQLVSLAAEGGHLEVVQWLVAEGYCRTPSACSSAASRGHLEVLQWLRGRGCPWGRETLIHAGSSHVFRWALEQGCPMDEQVSSACVSLGDLKMLQLVRSKGSLLGMNGPVGEQQREGA